MQPDESRWQLKAACRGINDVFYDRIWPEVDSEPDPGALRIADSICRRCPVRRSCYTTVMSDEQGQAADRRFGFAAAMTPAQRWSAEKRRAVFCQSCGEPYDPARSVDGDLACQSCSTNRHVPPIPKQGDQWNKRHTTLARRIVRWLVDDTGVGDVLPGTTTLSERFNVRAADVTRVLEALVIDGTLERQGPMLVRRGNPAAVRFWQPAHLSEDVS